MTDRGMSTAFVFGLLILALATAFFVPFVVDHPDELRMTTETIAEGSEVNVYHALNVSVETVQNNANATLTVKNTDLGLTNQTTLDEGAERDVIVGDDTVTINNTDTTAADATLEITYRANFGWPAPMKTVENNLGLIVMALLALILFTGAFKL